MPVMPILPINGDGLPALSATPNTLHGWCSIGWLPLPRRPQQNAELPATGSGRHRQHDDQNDQNDRPAGPVKSTVLGATLSSIGSIHVQYCDGL
jgi:hypothetical protein